MTASNMRYDGVAIFLHWTIAALIIFNLVTGLFHENLLAGLPLIPTHKAVGITVIFLTLIRIGWRLGHKPPLLPATIPPIERTIAKAGSYALYAFMLIAPISGWILSSWSKNPRPISWFGLFDIPQLPVTREFSRAGHEVHEIVGYIFAALVIVHIAAAVRHHFIKGDKLFDRMMPGGARRA